MINSLHKLVVLLSKNYLIQCTTCMKSASMNSYFIALIAFKIQNLIIFNHQWCLPLFASSQEITLPWDMDGQSPKLIFHFYHINHSVAQIRISTSYYVTLIPLNSICFE